MRRGFICVVAVALLVFGGAAAAIPAVAGVVPGPPGTAGPGEYGYCDVSYADGTFTVTSPVPNGTSKIALDVSCQVPPGMSNPAQVGVSLQSASLSGNYSLAVDSPMGTPSAGGACFSFSGAFTTTGTDLSVGHLRWQVVCNVSGSLSVNTAGGTLALTGNWRAWYWDPAYVNQRFELGTATEAVGSSLPGDWFTGGGPDAPGCSKSLDWDSSVAYDGGTEYGISVTIPAATYDHVTAVLQRPEDQFGNSVPITSDQQVWYPTSADTTHIFSWTPALGGRYTAVVSCYLPDGSASPSGDPGNYPGDPPLGSGAAVTARPPSLADCYSSVITTWRIGPVTFPVPSLASLTPETFVKAMGCTLSYLFVPGQDDIDAITIGLGDHLSNSSLGGVLASGNAISTAWSTFTSSYSDGSCSGPALSSPGTVATGVNFGTWTVHPFAACSGDPLYSLANIIKDGGAMLLIVGTVWVIIRIIAGAFGVSTPAANDAFGDGKTQEIPGSW